MARYLLPFLKEQRLGGPLFLKEWLFAADVFPIGTEWEMENLGSEPTRTGERRFVRILSEIGRKGDLPAGAEVIQQIQTAIRNEDCSTLDVVRIILKDTALSSKVLRVVNSSFYRRMGNPVSTVTGAIVLLGFQTIRDLSAGLLLIDHFTRKGGSRHVPDELRRSLHCGILSQRLSGDVGHSSPEEAYLLGLIANFGHLWVAAYYPGDFDKAARLQKEEHISIERALGRVIGCAPGEIAAAALGGWNFPSHYLDYFHKPPAKNRQSLVTPGARLSAIVKLSADYLASTEMEGPDGGRWILRRFQDLFSLEPEVFLEAARAAKDEFTEQALVNGLSTTRAQYARFLTDPESSDDVLSGRSPSAREPEAQHAKEDLHDASARPCQHEGDHSSATAVKTQESETLAGLNGEVPPKAAPAERGPVSPRSVAVPSKPPSTPARMGEPGSSVPSEDQANPPAGFLELDPVVPASLERDAATALGIMADISRSILDRNHITQTLSMVLEGIGRIGAFDVVFLALLNPKGDRVFGRLGYGEGVQEPLGSLSVLIRKNSGMIADTILQSTPHIAAHSSAAVLVPEGAPVPPIPGESFISYPVTVRGKTLGALVAARTEGPAPTEADLAVLSLFCDQACLALEKSVT